MTGIEVDFEVFKALTVRRAAESVTYNDVLREMLELPPSLSKPQTEQKAWTWKGVTLPEGTELRAEYKGKVYTAKIAGGEWMQDGKPQSSPSAAAFAITNSGVNGWWFWSVKRPNDPTWGQLGKLRPES
jgi:hypothetical protein